MRRNWTRNVRDVLVLAVGLLVQSCTADVQEPLVQPESHDVRICAGGSGTRTEMMPNGLSAVWSPGDELAVWAVNSSGIYTLDRQIFKTYGIDAGRGFFSSTLDAAMPEDSYTYYCCYPDPVSMNGTLATFNISAVQDGKASAGVDVMVATPVQHGALTPVPDPEDHSEMNMEMNRMMHQFRFFVPQDDTLLGDEKIERIFLTFPSGVVGDVTVDVAAPETQAVLSNAQADIELDLAQPIGVSSADEYQFACLSMAPVQFAEGESLTISKAYTADRIAYFDPIDLKAKDCEPGHSTPVRLEIREIVDYPFNIIFTVDANNLGEGVNTIKFVAEGCDWKGDGSNVFEYTPGYKINPGEVIKFYFDYHQEDLYRAFSGKDISITYESDHAIVSQTVNIGDAVGADAINISLTVPYLFYEDFSNLAAYDGGWKNGPYTSTGGASEDGIDLGQYGLSGWSGARTGCDAAGVAIAVSGRVDYVILGATRAYARLDSPAMTSLKHGANVNLELSFNYSGSKDGSSSYYHAAVVGTTVEAGVLNGYATQFSNSISWNGVTYPTTINNIPTDGSAATATLSMTSTFSDCTSATRLTWHVVAMGKGGISNSNTWLYVDNVKVKIAE